MAKNLAAKLKKARAVAQKIQKIAKDVKKIEQVASRPMASLGGFAGKKLGSERIGRGIGSMLGKITGTGDYIVTQNTLGSRSVLGDGPLPTFSRGDHTLRVQFEEYIGDVVSSSDGSFRITKYAINPGIFSTFPWLSSIAANFDQWEPNGIVFHFSPTAGAYTASGALGSVIMATDYDPNDPDYEDKREMLASQFSCSGPPTGFMSHPVECAKHLRMMNLLKNRFGSATPLQEYDLGNFFVASVGCANNIVLGELKVSYDITFHKNQIYGGLLGRTTQVANFRSSTGVSNAAPFGIGQTYSSTSMFACNQTSNSDLVFPQSLKGGTFLVSLQWEGTSATTDVGVTYSTSAIAGPKYWYSGGNPTSIIKNNGTDTILTLQFTLYLPAGNALSDPTITLNSVSLPTSGSVSCCIVQINKTVGW